MVWKILISELASKQFKKMDKSIAKHILGYLKERVAKQKDPTLSGKPLLNDKSGLWRYRIGDYRVICEIRNHELTILVLKIGHRRNVYDK